MSVSPALPSPSALTRRGPFRKYHAPNRIETTLAPLMIFISVQFTDYSIYSVKVGDLLSLCVLVTITPHIFRWGPTIFRKLYVVFFITLCVSLVVDIWTDFAFVPNNLPILKQPALISFSRFLQLAGCVAFAQWIGRLLSLQPGNIKILKRASLLMFGMGGFWIVVGLLGSRGMALPFTSDGRLVGGYVEGGPFGNMYAFYFCFHTLLFGLNPLYGLITVALIILSQSKAAVLLLVLFAVFSLLEPGKMRLPARLAAIFLVLSMIPIAESHFQLSSRIMGYANDRENILEEIRQRPDDGSLIMGRVSASFIGPEMFEQNPILGVGLGNYSLVRNDPRYRGVFPFVDAWDLPGLGGLLTFVIECGVFGLVLLGWAFLPFEISGNKLNMIALFFCALLTGVQLYFQYPWLAISVYAFLRIGSAGAAHRGNRSIERG